MTTLKHETTRVPTSLVRLNAPAAVHTICKTQHQLSGSTSHQVFNVTMFVPLLQVVLKTSSITKEMPNSPSTTAIDGAACGDVLARSPSKRS